MRDEDKSLFQLCEELQDLRRHIAELEAKLTNRRQPRMPSEENEMQLEQILLHMPVLFDAFSENGVALFWNRECERVTGYQADEIVGNPLAMELLVPDAAYRNRVLEQLHRLGHFYRDWELDIRCKNGETRTIAWSNISRDCPIPGWWSWGIGIDVTERNRAERALRASKEQLRQNETRYKKAQKLGHVGNWEYDLETAHFWGSDEAKRIYGLTPDSDDFSTDDVENCIPERERVHRALIDLIDKETPYDLEFEVYPRNSQQPIVIMSKAELLRNADGTPAKVTGVIQDVTARKRAEEALQRHLQHLEEIVEERTRELRKTQERLILQERLAVLGQMAGSIGHELRNPLATISNAVYYLKLIAPEADETFTEYLEIIAGETRNAEKIIRELLDFARVKTIAKEPSDVPTIVGLVLERWKPPDSVQLLLDIPDDMPEFFVDRRHVEQVMLNLLTNACEAMPQGGRLTIRAAADRSQISLSVTDTGCGISEAHLEKLFEPLFTTKTKGIGLGLAISKNLLEANGGFLTVESRKNQGSTFTLIFPI